MAIKEIEQNTDYLSDDIARLEDEKASLEQAIDAMFAAVQELESTWKGPAKESFRIQFQNDYEKCKEMNKILDVRIDKLRIARQEYDKCESEVGNIVRAIRV